MSAGDIDDILGPSGELLRLRSTSVLLDVYLSYVDSRPVIRGGVPYGAGISEDGQVVYLDSRLDVSLNGVDVSSALATHEQVEWGLRRYLEIGVDYATDPRGHRLANREEYNAVAGLFPELTPADAWDLYDEFIDPQVRKIETSPLDNVPYNLATYPYEHDEKIMDKIEAVRTFRDSPNGPEQCSECSMFTSPDRCKLVTKVVPYGWCEEFEDKNENANEAETED
jgi:hypothetical protein